MFRFCFGPNPEASCWKISSQPLGRVDTQAIILHKETGVIDQSSGRGGDPGVVGIAGIQRVIDHLEHRPAQELYRRPCLSQRGWADW